MRFIGGTQLRGDAHCLARVWARLSHHQLGLERSNPPSLGALALMLRVLPPALGTAVGMPAIFVLAPLRRVVVAADFVGFFGQFLRGWFLQQFFVEGRHLLLQRCHDLGLFWGLGSTLKS